MPKEATKAGPARVLVVWDVQSQGLVLVQVSSSTSRRWQLAQPSQAVCPRDIHFFWSSPQLCSLQASDCQNVYGVGSHHVPFPLFGLGTRNCPVACKFPLVEWHRGAYSSCQVINVIFQAGSERMKIGPAFSFSVARRSLQRFTSQLSRMIMQVLTLSRDSLRGGASCFARIRRIGETQSSSTQRPRHIQTRDDRRHRAKKGSHGQGSRRQRIQGRLR